MSEWLRNLTDTPTKKSQITHHYCSNCISYIDEYYRNRIGIPGRISFVTSRERPANPDVEGRQFKDTQGYLYNL